LVEGSSKFASLLVRSEFISLEASAEVDGVAVVLERSASNHKQVADGFCKTPDIEIGQFVSCRLKQIE